MSVRRHTVYNLCGAGASLAITLVTVPLYIHEIGEARYGVLAIVWMLLGYFGLFDMGLSRATAQAVAARGDEGPAKRSDIFWGALFTNACFGLVGGIALYFASRVILARVMPLDDTLMAEVLPVLPWVACAIPLATTTGILNGILLGRGNFLELNALQVFGSAIFQTAPVATAYLVGPQLQWVIPAAILARFAASVPFAVMAARVLPIRAPKFTCLAEIRPLLRFGAWITGASLVGPLLATADRLVIGAFLGPKAVSFYAVPLGIADRLNILPRSLAQALFPSFAADARGPEEVRRMEEAVSTVSSILAPVCCACLVVLPHFLAVWIGADFAAHASLAGQILFVGTWLNGAAIIPLTRLHATGRPDLPLKFYGLELAPYFLLLWLALTYWGLAGAAIAWSVRAGADMVLLALAAGLSRRHIARFGPNLAIMTAAIAAPYGLADTTTAALTGAALVVMSLAISWRQTPLWLRASLMATGRAKLLPQC